jgi:ALG11 mannosyltransferase N-terminus
MEPTAVVVWKALLYILAIATVLVILVTVGWHRLQTRQARLRRGTTIAFFHPHCGAGGGGERVLWKMVQVLGDLVDRGMLLEKVIIYTVDPPSESYPQGT